MTSEGADPAAPPERGAGAVATGAVATGAGATGAGATGTGATGTAATGTAATGTAATGTGATRTTRGERTRAKLLDAARVAFTGVPWNRARVEDVCRAAGVGHGTYYAYFANKQAILEALVRRHADALYRLAEEPWTSGHVEEDVRRVIGGFVALSEADRDIREVWFAAAPSEPALHDLVSEVRRQFVARVRAALSAAVEAGVARADLDVAVAATALAAMVEQTVTLAQRGEGVPVERLVDGLTDLWVHAVYR